MLLIYSKPPIFSICYVNKNEIFHTQCSVYLEARGLYQVVNSI